jgi:hypothetical protein
MLKTFLRDRAILNISPYLRNGCKSWVWWCTPVTPTLGRLRQEDLKFEVSLDYTVRPSFKNFKKKEGRKEGRERV